MPETASPPLLDPEFLHKLEQLELVSSKIFVGHRALGYVSNHVPLVTRYINRRKEHLIVTSVGRVFHTYGGAKFGLLSVSKIHAEDITCLAAGELPRFYIYNWIE